jgi:hypothetical protein
MTGNRAHQHYQCNPEVGEEKPAHGVTGLLHHGADHFLTSDAGMPAALA